MRLGGRGAAKRARRDTAANQTLSPVYTLRRLRSGTRRFALGQQTGDPGPFVADPDRLAQRFDELGLGVIVPPAPGVVELDEMVAATLRQGDPFAGDTIKRARIAFGHRVTSGARANQIA